jgi:hypothetical protein
MDGALMERAPKARDNPAAKSRIVSMIRMNKKC